MTDVHGIVYAYHSSSALGDLTRNRTNASLPFAGRYRLIDFALSSLSNAGVRDVGVIMQRDFQSLLDHVAGGKAWDISRRRGGLKLLPPFGTHHVGDYAGTAEALNAVMGYVKGIPQEHIVLIPADVLCNVDIAALVEQHVKSGCGITAVCTKRNPDAVHYRLTQKADGKVEKVLFHQVGAGEGGEFLTIKVENMTLQHHENHMDERFKRARKAMGIVTVASGAGLTHSFREMGADAVIEGGQTMNPPVESFLEAFDEVSADTILVFPNNSNIILTARQAADLYKEARVVVIPTKTLGEGYFAMANLNADLPLEELAKSLEEAAASVTTGSVSKAIRTTADAREGEYIGFSGKDVLCCCPGRAEAVKELAGKLSAGESDIIILLQGADAPAQEAGTLQQELQKACPMSEVILLDGGQPVYDYILVLC